MSKLTKLVIGLLLMLLALCGIAKMLFGQSPLSVGPDDVIRMARWSGTQWLPLWAVGVTGPLYVGPGKVGRLAYWDATLAPPAWKEWNGTVPITAITAGNWKVFYSNGTGNITELPLGAAGTIIRSAGVAAAPTMVTQAFTEHTGANWSAWYTNGTGVPTALALPAQYYYLQGNGVAAAPSFVDVLRPARAATTAGPDTFNRAVIIGYTSTDTVFGYTNSQWTVPSFGMSFTGAGSTDSCMMNSGDSIYIKTAYLNVKTPGTVAGADSFWFYNKTVPDSSARCVVPFGTTSASYNINKVFGPGVIVCVSKMGGTIVGMRNYVINANYGLRKQRAW